MDTIGHRMWVEWILRVTLGEEQRRGEERSGVEERRGRNVYTATLDFRHWRHRVLYGMQLVYTTQWHGVFPTPFPTPLLSSSLHCQGDWVRH